MNHLTTPKDICMTSAAFATLERTRYQIVRAFAIGIIVLAALFAIFLFAFMIMTANTDLSMVLILAICDVVVGSITLALPRDRPLWQRVIPLAIIIGLGIVAAGLIFPDAKIAIMTVFLVVILLVSLIGNSNLTLGAVIVCGLLVVVMMIIPPIPTIKADLGVMLPFIQVAAIIANFVLVWLINDRQTSALTSAITMSHQRAVEAETARNETELARADLEQQNNEKARLLELVQTLEMPIIPIGQNVLVMPLVGSLDSRRADAIQRRLLEEVTRLRARTVVLDVTGISIVDTAVARQLLRTAQAVRLLGAQTLLSGITATVAQTLVSLGVNLNDLTPVSDLGQALDKARQL